MRRVTDDAALIDEIDALLTQKVHHFLDTVYSTDVFVCIFCGKTPHEAEQERTPWCPG
jgi:GTP cyclohydrolase III